MQTVIAPGISEEYAVTPQLELTRARELANAGLKKTSKVGRIDVDRSVEHQFSDGRCTESITRTSTGPLADSSFKPNCSMAVNIVGRESRENRPSFSPAPGTGGPPPRSAALVLVLRAKALAGITRGSMRSKSPSMPVLSITARPDQFARISARSDMLTLMPCIPPSPGINARQAPTRFLSLNS